MCGVSLFFYELKIDTQNIQYQFVGLLRKCGNKVALKKKKSYFQNGTVKNTRKLRQLFGYKRPIICYVHVTDINV